MASAKTVMSDSNAYVMSVDTEYLLDCYSEQLTSHRVRLRADTLRVNNLRSRVQNKT